MPTAKIRSAAVTLSNPEGPRLRLERLTTPQLQPVDLDLAAGECVTLTAASGTGKTRLLRAIADLDEHGGRIYLDGRECGAWDPPLWRRQVGLLPAEGQWWRDTAAEHFPTVDQDALAAVGVGRELLQRPVSHLSTGERQRLALVRLLGNRPRVLLLDEPTAALDAESAGRVEALIAAYRRREGAAVIWVSHDAAQARRVADRRLTIAAGRVTEA